MPRLVSPPLPLPFSSSGIVSHADKNRSLNRKRLYVTILFQLPLSQFWILFNSHSSSTNGCLTNVPLCTMVCTNAALIT